VNEPDWTSILPPVLAIGLAIATRQVILSLLAGIWMAYWLLGGASPLPALAAGIDGVVAVLASPGDARVIGFALVIGALIAVIERTGGVRGFVAWLTERRWVDSGVRAQWLAWGTGIVVFIESNLTLLVAGAVSRPLFDRFRLSRERLAYLIDATSAPVCILIPLNAWGAFNLSLLDGTGVTDPLGVFVAAIPLNLYAIAAVVLAALVIRFDWSIGPMARADARTREGRLLWPGGAPMVDPSLLGSQEDDDAPVGRARDMVVPIAVLVAMVPIGLWITGDGDLAAGSGSTAVLWAVLVGLLVAWGLALAGGHDVDMLMQTSLRGAGGLLPVAIILLLALALGNVTGDLGTGRWLSQLVSENVPLMLLPALVFAVAAFTAFSIGSSWGTFAIMIPIAVPIAMALDLPPALFLAAALSGGVFGDHASPISDTTVVASMAAATDHIDHVRTQLPYALIAGAVALAGFLVAGLTL
jgi:Na+/H+ antiporter NhaC